MVLRCFALALFVSACATSRPVLRAEKAVPVAVVLVQDGQAPDAAPELLVERVTAALKARNLEPELVSPDRWQDAFATRRTTRARLAWMREAVDTPTLLLVETSADFYSQLSGRFRWNVHARATLAKGGAEDAFELAQDYSAFADFDHQRESHAITVASGRIADDVGALADRLLEGSLPPEKAASSAPSGAGRLGSVYFVMVDRFANGDTANDADADPGDPAAFHGGDLQGLIDRIDYLAALGVETVWLSPVTRMRTEKLNGHGAFHGYWPLSFTEMEPRFGDLALLRRLSDELHARGMKLLLDVVTNHVAYDAPLLKEKPEWFHRLGDIRDWNDRTQLERHDVHGLPDLTQENEAVYAHLLASAKGWIDAVQPDGFRLDAVKHVPAAFWRRFNEDVRAHAGDGFVLLGEDLEGDATKLSARMKDGRFDALFDFPLHFATLDTFCREVPAGRLAAVLSLDRLHPHPERLVTLLDNHDLPRVASMCPDPKQRRAALAFQLASRGVPSFTWGFEAGLAGEKEPENRADMVFDRSDESADLAARMLRLRRAHPSLESGETRVVSLDEDMFVVARIAPEEAALVAVSLGDETPALSLPTWLEGSLEAGDPVLHHLGLAPRGCPPLSRCEEPRARSGGVSIAFVKPRAGERFVAPDWRSVPVTFAISGAPEGTLVVVGAGEELGNWDPAKAPQADETGVLKADLPRHTVAELKLAVRADGQVTWSPGANRYVHVADGAQTVKLEWNGPGEG